MLTQIIGAQLREKGWSQSDLSRASGLSKGLISLILSGHLLNITVDTAGKLATALDIPSEQISNAALADIREAKAVTG